MKRILIFTLIAIFLGAGSVFAATLNVSGWTDITTYDQMKDNVTFGPQTDARKSTFTYTLTNTYDGTQRTVIKDVTAIKEDGETEQGTQPGQVWDLEGIFLNEDSNQVAIVGGYDFWNGYGGYAPGDIFISTDFDVDVPALRADTGSQLPQTGLNDWRGYEVVLDVSGSTYDIYNNNNLSTAGTPAPWTTENTFFNTVGTPDAGASPWRIHDPNKAEWSTGTGNLGFYNFVTGSGFEETPRYALVFDLNDIFGNTIDDQTFFIHYTYQCGNDSIAAAIENYSGSPVPEPATLLLLGTGLIGLAGAGRRKFSKKS